MLRASIDVRGWSSRSTSLANVSKILKRAGSSTFVSTWKLNQCSVPGSASMWTLPAMKNLRVWSTWVGLDTIVPVTANVARVTESEYLGSVLNPDTLVVV